MDIGSIVVIIAVLFFYLRLTILRRRGKPGADAATPSQQSRSNGPAWMKYTILSPNRRDWMIAGAGAALIAAGFFINRLAGPSLAPFWWIPFAVRIVAFSWGFR